MTIFFVFAASAVVCTGIIIALVCWNRHKSSSQQNLEGNERSVQLNSVTSCTNSDTLEQSSDTFEQKSTILEENTDTLDSSRQVPDRLFIKSDSYQPDESDTESAEQVRVETSLSSRQIEEKLREKKKEKRRKKEEARDKMDKRIKRIKSMRKSAEMTYLLEPSSDCEDN